MLLSPSMERKGTFSAVSLSEVGFISDRNVAPVSHSGGTEAMINFICGANGGDNDATSIIMARLQRSVFASSAKPIDLFDGHTPL